MRRPTTKPSPSRSSAGRPDERRYDPLPWHPPLGGEVLVGFSALAVAAGGARVVAVDGPEIAPWSLFVERLTDAMVARGRAPAVMDARQGLLEWSRFQAATTSARLAEDPDFERLANAEMGHLLTRPVQADPDVEGPTIIVGPGAALSRHDLLWYLDWPKRYAEAAVTSGQGRNLGQPARDSGAPTTRRLFYVDWPILDRHRDAIRDQVALWVDGGDPERPAALDGPTLAATSAALACRPFRTRPTFNTTTWGGHWGQRELGMDTEQLNTALGYELIAPESGVLVGRPSSPEAPGAAVEVPFHLLVASHPTEILGSAVRARFGTSFPIRFDYLDTMDGGNLSIHCHPRADYMREVFGWPYTQDETYYVMVAGQESHVFLGLRDVEALDAFEAQAARADEEDEPFDITQHVQTFPAVAHQLYLVPSGTPHGSGAGNVVLEISATPYLYSLRFYDWLRRDAEGAPRSVHVQHAFANLGRRCSERVAAELVPPPVLTSSGAGWREELLGSSPEMFFAVHRLALEAAATIRQQTGDRFHILNVVDGDGVDLSWSGGARMEVAYAETVVVPAAVGNYRIRAWESSPVRVVKAQVQ